MNIMTVTGDFDAPAASVWAIVSDFGKLDSWNPAVLSISSQGSGAGMLRVFETATSVVTEELLECDSDARTIGYKIVSGTTIKVKDAQLRITVVDLGNSRCRLDWQMFGEPDGIGLAEVRASTEARYLKRLEDLRAALTARAASTN